jgi:hypothetical protein
LTFTGPTAAARLLPGRSGRRFMKALFSMSWKKQFWQTPGPGTIYDPTITPFLSKQHSFAPGNFSDRLSSDTHTIDACISCSSTSFVGYSAIMRPCRK